MITKIESNSEYHSSDAISASGLKKIHETSVWHYLRDTFSGSPATRLGSAIHTILLEPENFDEEFIVYKNGTFNRKTKAGREQYKKWLEGHSDKELLDDTQEVVIDRILERFQDDQDQQIKVAKQYMKGDIELSHYLNYEGVPVRVRPDCLGDDFIMDIKTTQNTFGEVTPEFFKRQIWNRNYHVQAMFYCDMVGRDPKNFRYVVIETKPPYEVFVCGLDEDMIFKGRIAYNEALTDWKLYKMQAIVSKYKNDLAPDGSIIL